MTGEESIPVGVNLTTIGVTSNWWLQAARRVEGAGYRGVWAWDHFMTFVRRGPRSDSVLECWTLLAAAAASTERLRVGSFVVNVMNRHPQVLARIVATLADLSGGRVELGIGIGGNPTEHTAYAIPFPEAAERAARLEEAIAVLRLLLAGGPADYDGQFYQLHDAYAFPTPQPMPRIIVGAETPAGGRLAARVADGVTIFANTWDRVMPVFLEGLEKAGRRREDVSVLVGLDLEKDIAPEDQPALADLAATAAQWKERGADEIVLHWIRPDALDAVLAAGERAGLAG